MSGPAEIVKCVSASGHRHQQAFSGSADFGTLAVPPVDIGLQPQRRKHVGCGSAVPGGHRAAYGGSTRLRKFAAG